MTKIIKIGNLKVIEKSNKKICIKENNDKNIIKKYDYLKSKDFNFIPKEVKLINNYEERIYLDEIAISKEDKINELINLLIMLHTNTTFYKNLTINEIKEYYEKETDEIIEIKKYYESIFDNNIIYTYLKPSISLLIRNVSIILISLDKSKYYLDMWYKTIKNKMKKRVVFNHNNLKISNYIRAENPYLINWYNSNYDYQINDLVSLFKHNYSFLCMKDIFDRYNLKYPLYEEEKNLFYSHILKCNKIKLDKNELLNTKEVFDLITYLKKVNSFLNNYMKN